jgi:hypothetical protein
VSLVISIYIWSSLLIYLSIISKFNVRPWKIRNSNMMFYWYLVWKLRYNNLPKIASNRKVIHVPILLFHSTKIAEETQTKDYKIGICCFSAKHTAIRRKCKDWMSRNQDNVSEWATCLSVNCCFSELTL